MKFIPNHDLIEEWIYDYASSKKILEVAQKLRSSLNVNVRREIQGRINDFCVALAKRREDCSSCRGYLFKRQRMRLDKEINIQDVSTESESWQTKFYSHRIPWYQVSGKRCIFLSLSYVSRSDMALWNVVCKCANVGQKFWFWFLIQVPQPELRPKYRDTRTQSAVVTVSMLWDRGETLVTSFIYVEFPSLLHAIPMRVALRVAQTVGGVERTKVGHGTRT